MFNINQVIGVRLTPQPGHTAQLDYPEGARVIGASPEDLELRQSLAAEARGLRVLAQAIVLSVQMPNTERERVTVFLPAFGTVVAINSNKNGRHADLLLKAPASVLAMETVEQAYAELPETARSGMQMKEAFRE